MIASRDRAHPDALLISVFLALLALGVVTVYSSSAIYALDRFGSSTYFLWRQLLWTALGLGAGAFFFGYDHRKLRRWMKPALAACLLLLVAVLVAGHRVGGARRWLRIGGIGFQPSEFAKLALVLFVAHYCDKKRSRLGDFKRGVLPLLGVIGLFCALILVQPDLGTPVLIMATCLSVMLIAGVRTGQVLSLALALLTLAGAAVWIKPYRRRRLLAFLNPWEDAQGASYQLVQSLLALGSGGLTGVGLGESRSKLLYLPEPHTDFIFPIFGEEFGLLGSGTVLFLFGMIAWLGFRIAARSTQLYSSLLASGITLLLIFQAAINIAMVTGCLPTKGLPLPFLSFGGSSLVVTLSAAGILLNISRGTSRSPEGGGRS